MDPFTAHGGGCPGRHNGIALRAPRAMTCVIHIDSFCHTASADQRPIVRSRPVIPLETAEFDSDGLADVRQRVISTPLQSVTGGSYRDIGNREFLRSVDLQKRGREVSVSKGRESSTTK